MATKLTTDKAVKKVHIAEVVRHGEAFVVPEGLPLDKAIESLMRLQRLEEETYQFVHTFEAFVWDGAVALQQAIINIFGFGFGERSGFFGSQPPQLVEVSTGPSYKDKVMVPWGQFSLPNVEGALMMGGGVENGKFVFKIQANVKRKHERQIQALADEVRRLLASGSIYRGKAIKMSFKSDKRDPWTGEVIPNTPEFINLRGVSEHQLVLNADVADAVATNLFTPIDRLEDLRAEGEPFKRGVLLAGTFGTGKTLTANITAVKAQAAGVTFLLCENADEFAEAVSFAKMYAPAVVFCEDIDRVLRGERSVSIDQILNTVDGIESKNTEVLVVLTTNDAESINQAAMRPGRFDAVINFEKPDAESAARLIRLYAKGAVGKDVDVSVAGATLAGNIPAVIAEAVKRAKLSAIRLSEPGSRNIGITPEAMLDAAKSMKMQLDLLQRDRSVEPSRMELAANIIGLHIKDGLERAIKNARDAVGQDAVTALATNGNGKSGPIQMVLPKK